MGLLSTKMEAILTRSSPLLVPQCGQVQSRGMATLKEISIRLKSVTNVQKITKSMKMVSAAKYARAERELRPAKAFGVGAQSFYKNAEVEQDKSKPNHLVVALSSDRGLCGGIHSAVAKYIRAMVEEQGPNAETKLVIIGDKAKAVLSRTMPQNILYSFNDYDRSTLIYNLFKSVISYETSEMPLFSAKAIENAAKYNLYDSLDEDVLLCYNEFSMTSLILYAMKEGACSEQSARMTAMDAASKNAGEMIDKLTLTFNRTRQAVITRELIEIISGAAAL